MCSAIVAAMKNRGFTIVEILIAMGLVSGIALTLMYTVLSGNRAAINSQRMADLVSFQSTLHLAASRESTCKMMLAGQPFKITGVEEVTLSLPGFPPISKGSTWSGWSFDSVRLEYESTAEPKLHYASLVFTVKKKISGLPDQSFTRSKPILIQTVLAGDQVASCNPDPVSPSPLPSASPSATASP